MEVAVLQPHDCLKRSTHHEHHNHNQRHRYSTTINSNPSPNGNSNRSKRRKRNSNSHDSIGPSKAQQSRSKSPPEMGHVRILKRGEELNPPISVMIHAPKITRSKPRPVVNGLYAGSAFISSPSPSEVPLPAFFGKKNNQEIATELRRLLKLM